MQTTRLSPLHAIGDYGARGNVEYSRCRHRKGRSRAARELLRPLRGRGLSSPRSYGYLAASFLDLGDYQAATEACGRAAELVAAKQELRSGEGSHCCANGRDLISLVMWSSRSR